ncbi:MAG: hypothetical protein V2I97_01745 [Desulfococcaceae bacterium]|jgi:hypothetical protein|nr:hypothetical protein [Desulfococcaceae bacterium]
MKKENIVTLRTKGNRNEKKDISDEPEMKELKRMIEKGELDPDRIKKHLEE